MQDARRRRGKTKRIALRWLWVQDAARRTDANGRAAVTADANAPSLLNLLHGVLRHDAACGPIEGRGVAQEAVKLGGIGRELDHGLVGAMG